MENTEAFSQRIVKFRPPRIALVMLVIAACIQWMSPITWFQLPRLPLASAVAGLAGFLIMMRGWWLFRRENTPICPTAQTTKLITTDVYRLTRNPMYLGIVMMLLAVALFTGGFSYYLATAAFFAIIDLAFCPYEERKLLADFGETFDSYRKSVRRWI